MRGIQDTCDGDRGTRAGGEVKCLGERKGWVPKKKAKRQGSLGLVSWWWWGVGSYLVTEDGAVELFSVLKRPGWGSG